MTITPAPHHVTRDGKTLQIRLEFRCTRCKCYLTSEQTRWLEIQKSKRRYCQPCYAFKVSLEKAR